MLPRTWYRRVAATGSPCETASDSLLAGPRHVRSHACPGGGTAVHLPCLPPLQSFPRSYIMRSQSRATRSVPQDSARSPSGSQSILIAVALPPLERHVKKLLCCHAPAHATAAPPMIVEFLPPPRCQTRLPPCLETPYQSGKRDTMGTIGRKCPLASSYSMKLHLVYLALVANTRPDRY